MQTGVNHQSNGSHHLGGESAEILTGVLVKAHLDTQLLRIQTPSFNVSSTEILSLYIYIYIYLFIYLFTFLKLINFYILVIICDSGCYVRL
jgi:hypothetical protein